MKATFMYFGYTKATLLAPHASKATFIYPRYMTGEDEEGVSGWWGTGSGGRVRRGPAGAGAGRGRRSRRGVEAADEQGGHPEVDVVEQRLRHRLRGADQGVLAVAPSPA
jgi:hypothetical protein